MSSWKRKRPGNESPLAVAAPAAGRARQLADRTAGNYVPTWKIDPPTWKLVPENPNPQNEPHMLYTPGTLVPVWGRRPLGRNDIPCTNDDDLFTGKDLVEGRGYADKVGNDPDGKTCYVPDGLERWAAINGLDPNNRDPMTVGDLDMLGATFVSRLNMRAQLDCADGDASRDKCVEMGTALLDTLHSTITTYRDEGRHRDGGVQIHCSVGPMSASLGYAKNKYDLRMKYADHDERPDYVGEERTGGMSRLRYTNEGDAGQVRVGNSTMGVYHYSKHDKPTSFATLEAESRPLFRRVGLDWQRPGNRRDAPYNLIIGTIVARLIEGAMGRGMGSDLVFEGPVQAGGDHEASARLAAQLFKDVHEEVWAHTLRTDSLPTHFETRAHGTVLKFNDPPAAEAALTLIRDFYTRRGHRIRRGDSGPLSKVEIDRMVFNNFFAVFEGEGGGLRVLSMFHGHTTRRRHKDMVFARAANVFDDKNHWNDGTFSTMRQVTTLALAANRNADVTVEFDVQSTNSLFKTRRAHTM